MTPQFRNEISESAGHISSWLRQAMIGLSVFILICCVLSAASAFVVFFKEPQPFAITPKGDVIDLVQITPQLREKALNGKANP